MTTSTPVSPRNPADDELAATARQMYDAETVLHAAFQSHIDAWVAAAYDRLHEAISAHTAALEHA